MEPPGGTTLPAQRLLVINPVSGFWLELPGSDDQPLGDTSLFPSFLVFSGSGLILIGGKVNCDH